MNLREATLQDSETLLRWRNDPEARSASRNNGIVNAEEHAEWLAESFADPDCLLLVAELEGETVGHVRFNRLGEGHEISIVVAPGDRGKGVGIRLIATATDWLWRTTEAQWIQAIVRTENERSRRAFQRAGFEGRKDNGFVCMVMERP